MQLIVANKNYSSWSMRPWLVLEHFDLPFEEMPVWLSQPDTRQQILRYSPTGRVPCLIDGNLTIWDSLAIVEYLADKFPEKNLWPADMRQRAHARSLCAEMHSGFSDLRTHMWMNIRASWPGKGVTPGVLADVRRIESIWEDCLARYEGPFLFGTFSIADAFFAPVVMRFATYAPMLSPLAQAYADRIWEVPAVKRWRDAACAETQTISAYDIHP